MSLTPSMIQLLEADENGRDYKASWTGDEKLTWDSLTWDNDRAEEEPRMKAYM